MPGLTAPGGGYTVALGRARVGEGRRARRRKLDGRAQCVCGNIHSGTLRQYSHRVTDCQHLLVPEEAMASAVTLCVSRSWA